MLSFITVCRNDNYGGDFTERFARATHSNLSILNQTGIDYEYIIVDWNSPDKKYMYLEPDFATENTNGDRAKHFIVDDSVVKAEGLSSEIMYEYFAKNVGIRNSIGSHCCVFNSDIIISPELLSLMCQVDEGPITQFYYRPRYSVTIPLRADVEDVLADVTHRSLKDMSTLPDLKSLSVEDLEKVLGGMQLDFYDPSIDSLGEVASGDYIFVPGDFLRNVVKGYDETNPGHRTNKRQSSMDSELVINLAVRGLRIQYLDANYYHIFHNRCWVYDGGAKRTRYENKDTWGLSTYTKEKIKDNVTLIKA